MLSLFLLILSVSTSFGRSPQIVEPRCRACNCVCNPRVVVEGGCVVTNITCPPLFTQVDGACYRITSDPSEGVNQTTATSSCKRIGGRLAHFNTTEKLEAFGKWAKKTLNVSEHKSGKCARSLDIVFVLDGSASVPVKSFEDGKKFLEDISGQFHFGSERHQVQIGLITYSDTVNAAIQVTGSRQKFTQTVLGVRYPSGGNRYKGTNTAAALEKAGRLFLPKNGARAGVAGVLVLLTDGNSRKRSDTVKEALKLRAKGITIFCIAMGGEIDISELTAVATSPSHSHVIKVKRYAELPNIKRKLSDDICVRPVNLWVSGKLTDSKEWIDETGHPLPGINTSLVKDEYHDGRCVVVVIMSRGVVMVKNECERKEGVACEISPRS